MNLSGGITVEGLHLGLNWEVMELPYKAFYRKSVDLIRGSCAELIARVM